VQKGIIIIIIIIIITTTTCNVISFRVRWKSSTAWLVSSEVDFFFERSRLWGRPVGQMVH